MLDLSWRRRWSRGIEGGARFGVVGQQIGGEVDKSPGPTCPLAAAANLHLFRQCM